jgi:acyl carrier protein
MSQSVGLVQTSPRPVTANQLRDLISAEHTLIEVETLDDTMSFDEAGADSFDFFTIIVAAESEFGLRIPCKDFGKVASLKDLAAYINRQNAQGALVASRHG